MSRRPLAIGCLSLVLISLVLVAFAVLGALWQGRQTPKGAPEYVALGSSYAAGVGLGPRSPGSPALCGRSANGYPPQLARMRRLSLVDMSCSGALTRHVLRGGQFFQGPQIRTITAATRLVTLTVGGNDVGYVGDMSLLAARHSRGLVGWLASHAWKGPKSPVQRNYGRLRDALVATLQAIHERAPRAVVVVATYPTVLPPAGTCDRLQLSPGEADLMRQVGDRLAATTRAAAAQAGAILVDMHTLGAAHNACSPDPWTRGWTNGGKAPFHPTLAGAQATASAISEALPASF